MMFESNISSPQPAFVFTFSPAVRLKLATVVCFLLGTASIVIFFIRLPVVKTNLLLEGSFFLFLVAACYVVVFRQKIVFYDDRIELFRISGTGKKYSYDEIRDAEYGFGANNSHNAVLLRMRDSRMVRIGKEFLGDISADELMAFLRQKCPNKKMGPDDTNEESPLF